MKPITWRTPVVALALLAVYVAAYFWFGHSGRFDSDFYAWGLVAAFAAAPLLAVALTLARSHWWENDVGLNLVFLAVATMPENGGLAWTFLFNHGVLHVPVLAWIVIGGPWWYVVANLWRFRLIARNGRGKE